MHILSIYFLLRDATDNAVNASAHLVNVKFNGEYSYVCANIDRIVHIVTAGNDNV